MSIIYLFVCVCFNYFVSGSKGSSNLCETTELLREINSVKDILIVDNSIMKQIQINLMKDLQDQKKLIDENQQSLKTDLQDQKKLIDENQQSLKTDFLNLLEEIQSLKNITQSQDGLIKQIQQSLKTYPVPPTSTPSSSSSPTDCSDIFSAGQTKSGTYEIFPSSNQRNKSLEVFCDMEEGGGWTVFLSRDAASKYIDFNRNWNAYKELFGSANQEYWIGNENLHALTSNRKYEVRFDAKDGEGRHTWFEWKSFSVASEENNYELTFGGYDGRSTIEERYGFGVNNGRKFTTFDKDNDGGNENCAKRSKGGWWYYGCSYIFPTGIHGKEYPEGVSVRRWSKEDNSARYAKWLQFKIRPTN